MKTILAFTSIILLASTAPKAQNVDIFGISVSANPKVGLQNPPGPMLENTKFDVSEFKIHLLLPIQLSNGKTTIITGAEWYYVNPFFELLPESYYLETDLHSLEYTLGISQMWNDQWGTTVIARPTLASNFRDGISGDDFYMQGSAILFKENSQGWRYGLGVAYANGFGEPKTVPLLQLKYRSEKFDFDMVAPVNLSFKYNVGKSMIGLQAMLDGNQYNLRLGDAPNPRVENFDAIKFSRYNIGPVIGTNIHGHGRLEISGGISINRIFKAVNINDEESEFDLSSGAFLRAGFYFSK